MVSVVRNGADVHTAERHRCPVDNRDVGILAARASEHSTIAQIDDTSLRGKGYRTCQWCRYGHIVNEDIPFIIIIPIKNREQNIICASTEGNIGFEAVVAWNAVQRANVSPRYIGFSLIRVKFVVIRLIIDTDQHVKRIVLIVGVVRPSFHMDESSAALACFNLNCRRAACPRLTWGK